MNWTNEQKQAIEETNANILVAAAAGSGKTAVLVERIIHKVVQEKIDIDKILVVTFTNAAASEMRERILDAIYQKIEEEPENTQLQKQITLLNRASICTIHSFCLDVIRNHFYEINTSANFRVADTAEIELLKNDVLEDLFEQKYLENEAGFLNLIDTYTSYKGDEPLKELVLGIYKYIQSNPFPEKWINEKIEMFHLQEEQDFGQTIWGQIILEETKKNIQDGILKLKQAKKQASKFYELEKYSMTLQSDINELEDSLNKMDTWEEAYQKIGQINWVKWPIDKKVTLDLKNELKEIRDKVKKQISNHNIIYSSQEANQDMIMMYPILVELKNLTLTFAEMFSNKKREKNIIDFNDIEHLALKILIQEENGKIEQTEIAKKYQEKFAEIAIDEYQDSNLVQEYILNSIARGNNMFMVGDVKQSIYKFRQARPELFLEKYANYQLKEDKTKEQGLKIQLFKNFRSKPNIIEITNLVFKDIMSKKLGDIEYEEKEYLNYGANYPEIEGNKQETIAQLHIIDLKEKEDRNDLEENTKEEEQEVERIEDAVLEAKFVANKIKELIDTHYQVYDRKKEKYRDITYKDICVLLRATSVMAPIYEKEITELDLPVFSDTSTQYLEAMEVQTILSLLKIIDNPLQDIPLVTVLRSNIAGFNDNELIQIRLADNTSSFYEAMQKARLVVEKPLREKIERFLTQLQKWAEQEEYLALDELIWKIYMDTGFYHYVSLLTNGNLRQANLKMLFERAKQYEKASFKGLFNFIQFMDRIKTSSGDLGAAKLIGENEDVIRIMSIHKSKGLEFPIVFLSGTGKKFNMQDLNQPIILHEELGFGPKLIDSKKRIEYSTLAKEAIRMQTKRETISEEMRILYVALTRAKEKLIITGLSKDIEKALKEKRQMLEIYEEELKETPKIASNLLEKYISYLDWMELIYLKHKDTIENHTLKMYIHDKDEILKNKKTEEKETQIEEMIHEEVKKEYQEEKEKVEKILQWQYPYLTSVKLPTKTSVTKIKQMEQEEETEDIEDVINQNAKTKELVKSLTEKPKFMQEEQRLSQMQKGTVMHLCVQELDETKDYTIEEIEKWVQQLYLKQMITQVEKESIDIEVLYQYTKSELWKELKQAKEVHKEQPFYLNIPAKKINKEAQEEEKILVQGIIDLYYIDKEDRLILVDYKTDSKRSGETKTLEEKYEMQLSIYKEALEKALGRKVDKAMIYALSK